jgi:hypothetical protein
MKKYLTLDRSVNRTYIITYRCLFSITSIYDEYMCVFNTLLSSGKTCLVNVLPNVCMLKYDDVYFQRFGVRMSKIA